MPKIDIEREHNKPSRQEVKELVQQLADRLSDRYDLDCRWNGDDLEFKRKGADGRIVVDDRKVRLVMNVSMLLAPLKGEIEKRTHRYMDELIGPG
jgi:putative polyhydroxyalkanoate system protein